MAVVMHSLIISILILTCKYKEADILCHSLSTEVHNVGLLRVQENTGIVCGMPSYH